MTDPLFERLLGADDADSGCEAGFALMEQYADAVLRGDDVTLTYAGVVAHLRNCPACREDTEGLLAALRDIEPPPDLR
jgi:hypothetical protein